MADLRGLLSPLELRSKSLLSASDLAWPEPRPVARSPAAFFASQVRAPVPAGPKDGLALVLMTAPGHFARREAIRSTWLQQLEGASYAFALSMPEAFSLERIPKLLEQLQEEQEIYGDLLVLRPDWERQEKQGLLGSTPLSFQVCGVFFFFFFPSLLLLSHKNA